MGHRHVGIHAAVVDTDCQVTQVDRQVGFAPAAEHRQTGKQIRIAAGHAPGGEATQRQPHQMDPVRIHGVVLLHVCESVDHVAFGQGADRPATAHQRKDHQKGKIRASAQDRHAGRRGGGRPPVPALGAAMQKDDQRPALGFVVFGRQPQGVVDRCAIDGGYVRPLEQLTGRFARARLGAHSERRVAPKTKQTDATPPRFTLRRAHKDPPRLPADHL